LNQVLDQLNALEYSLKIAGDQVRTVWKAKIISPIDGARANSNVVDAILTLEGVDRG
jgi:hypothetical protein